MKELLRNPDSFIKILELTVSALSIDDIMTRVVEELRGVFNCDRCTLYVVDEKSNELYTRIAQKSSIGNFHLPLDRNRSIAAFVAIAGRPVMFDDVYDDRELKGTAPELTFCPDFDVKTAFVTKQMIAVPLQMGGATIGVLQALNKRGGFMKRDLDAMQEFAPLLALALNHALLAQKLAALENSAACPLGSTSLGPRKHGPIGTEEGLQAAY